MAPKKTISLAVLERARSDPRAFKRAQLKGEEQFFSYGFFNLLSNVIIAYHKKNLSTNAAQFLLEEGYGRHFKDPNMLAHLADQLSEYIAGFDTLPILSSECNRSISILLDDHGLSVKGRLLRIDMNKAGGYSGWLLVKKDAAWKDELRFPLVQAGLAEYFGVSHGEVTAGVYCVETSSYQSFKFSDQKIAAARKEAKKIVGLLTE